MVYGSIRGDAAGVEPGASPVNRAAVNVGTIRVRSTYLSQPGRSGGDRHDASRRRGWGGVAVVLRARESLCTWGRATACQLRRESNVRRRVGECWRCGMA